MEPQNDRIKPKANNGYVPRALTKHKTRIQWLNNLPDDIKQKALVNFQANYPGHQQESLLQREEPTLRACIESSFVLSKSPEGRQFWIDIINMGEDKR